ncbi:helix-turn-helix domain-containing protein [Paenibacillus medicaginis]|uniref:Helix-turn-helix domain-containing protein n=1 Tax=Paenibacillus medicaginis TaxID=1470560 RepID=A0ABV5BUR8_9BACL
MLVEIQLKYILEKKNISERELSRRTGIRQGTINDMCNNVSKQISVANLALICDELNIDISDLLKLKK